MSRLSRDRDFVRVVAFILGLMFVVSVASDYVLSNRYRANDPFQLVGGPVGASAPARNVSEPHPLPAGTELAWVPSTLGAAFLEPGHRVDVFATARVEDRPQAIKLLSSALVVEIRHDAPAPNTLAGLALTPEEGELLAQAQARDCTLSLVLRNAKSRTVPHDPSAVARLLGVPGKDGPRIPTMTREASEPPGRPAIPEPVVSLPVAPAPRPVDR